MHLYMTCVCQLTRARASAPRPAALISRRGRRLQEEEGAARTAAVSEEEEEEEEEEARLAAAAAAAAAAAVVSDDDDDDWIATRTKPAGVTCHCDCVYVCDCVIVILCDYYNTNDFGTDGRTHPLDSQAAVVDEGGAVGLLWGWRRQTSSRRRAC